MEENNTYLADAIEVSGLKAQYDAEVKKLLSSRQILARILKHAVSEFEDYTIEEIEECIEGGVEVDAVPVKPGRRRPEAVTGMSTEDKTPGEGSEMFDIRFYAVTKCTKRLKILFNVEAQKNSYPGYVLEHRGVFYAARMISAQLGTEFENQNYDDIKKVYSIWICMNSPKKYANTIVEYKMTKREIFGTINRDNICDLMSVIMIRLPQNGGRKNTLLGILDVLLSQNLSVEERKTILQNEYGLRMTTSMEGDMRNMCNLSDLVWERAMTEGMAQGMAKGMEQGRLAGKTEFAKLMLFDGEPLEKIMRYTGMLQEEIEALRLQNA